MKKSENRKKKHAYRFRYILTGWGIIFSILVAVVVIFSINISTSGAIDGVVQHDAGKFMQSLERRISWEGQTPILSDSSASTYQGSAYAIIDRKSEKVLASTLPSDVPIDLLLQSQEPSIDYETSHDHYYIRTKPINKLNDVRSRRAGRGDQFILCALIDYSEINTIYYDVKAFSIILILMLLFGMIVTTVIANHLMSRHLNTLTIQAETMTQTGNYDATFSTEGPFKEINTLAESYNNLLDQVNKTIKNQSQFNHDVSHELRTPVTVLQAQCQISKEQFGHNPDALRSIEVIERQTIRMSNLIQRLLDLSRLERSQIFDHTESVALDDVTRSICEDISLIKNDRINFSLLLEKISIQANTGLIHTMIKNLIENAVKYSPESEPITVSVFRLNNRVSIRVQDHGIGMSDEIKEHIFDAFYRGDEARSTEGFGLGLTLVKRIADLYHGQIQIDSKEGEGSVFTVHFPEKETEAI